MKKAFIFTIAFFAIWQTSFAYGFSAVAPSGQTLYYNIVNGNAEVTYQTISSPRYTSLFGNLTIPDTVMTYNGTTYTVTSIGPNAFQYCSGLTSVTIPNSVTSIGHDAFSGCSGLTSVTIPNSVTSIGQQAFSGCSGLTSVTIPNSVTDIGSYAFSNVRHIEYHGTATGSPWGAWSINGVSDGDFRYSDSSRTNLIGYLGNGSDVIVPDSVTRIGHYAFCRCSGLTSITIPNSVDSIEYCAFCDCSGLTTVNFNATNCTYISHGGPREVFSGCVNLTTLNIGNNVTRIPNYAFYGWSGLTSVTIPNSVTSIGIWAFYRCSGLTSVTIPNSVTSIGHYAFKDCSGLTSVTIGNSVTSIGTYAFYNCSGLTGTLTIPNSVTSIEWCAFQECSGLTSVTIGNSVANIGNSAFKDCSGLTTLNFNADSCVFAGSSKDSRAFNGCSSISTVNFGSNVKQIPSYLLFNCRMMTSVAIPNSVDSIGNFAFQDCNGLTSVTIGNSVTSIGEYAFSGCSALTGTIPSSVISIGYNAFYDVRHIEYYGSATGAPWGAITMNGVTDGDFVYADTTRTNLIAYIGNGGNVTVPNSVTHIGNRSFYCCISLASVTIPNSVTSIGSSAFSGCSGLTSVTIGSSVTTIDYRAFSGCSGLTEINSLNTVAPQLNLGQYQSDHPFSGVSTTIPVHISCGSLLSYSSRWSYFSNFIEASGHSFDAVTADSTMGSVTILTQPTCQAPTAVFNAVPNSGYRFSNWSDGNTTNPRSLVVTQDTVITAYFEASSDTVFIHDTVYIYDTIYIHDTIYVGGNAIDDVMTIDAKIYQRDGQIVVEGADGMPVMLYDATGRLLATRRSEETLGSTPVQFNVPVSGTYLVRVGNLPAKKVVVIR